MQLLKSLKTNLRSNIERDVRKRYNLLKKNANGSPVNFQLSLGKSDPANLQPMKIRLDEIKHPVKVKVHRYAPAQRKVLDNYVEKLLGMGVFIPTHKQLGKQPII